MAPDPHPRPWFRLWYALCYRLFLVFFGLGLATLNLTTWLLLWTARWGWARATCRRCLRVWFRLYRWGCRWTRVATIRYGGFASLPPGPCIYVANHPSLFDAPLLLAELPTHTLCIYKASLGRTIFRSPAARLSGYLANNAGLELIRAGVRALHAGHSILIFPEGTRTEPGVPLNPLRSAFAFMATEAGVPVIPITLHYSHPFLAKGQSVLRTPSDQVLRIDLTVADSLGPVSGNQVRRLCGQVAEALRPKSPMPAARDA